MKKRILGALAGIAAGALFLPRMGWAQASVPSASPPAPVAASPAEAWDPEPDPVPTQMAAASAPVAADPAQTLAQAPQTGPGIPAPANAPLLAAEPTILMPSAMPSGPRIWFGADYLLWWIKDGPIGTPLVTTGSQTLTLTVVPTTTPASPTPGTVTVNYPLTQGGLGVPSTQVLFGSGVGFGTISGLRLTGGAWLDQDRVFGIESSVFMLGRATNTFAATSTPATPLFVPIQDTSGFKFTTPITTSTGLVSSPTTISAPSSQFAIPDKAVKFVSQSQLWGAEVNGLAAFYREGGWAVNLLGGFRYIDLDETFQQQVPVNNYWGCSNRFYGGQLGVEADRLFGRFDIKAAAKLGLGDNHEALTINSTGSFVPHLTAAVIGGVPAVYSGAIPVFVGPNNRGRVTQDKAMVVPELRLDCGYRITSWVRADIGYSFLYLTNVIRPGNQVDTHTDGGNVGAGGTALFPAAPQLGQSDFFAHGVNFSVTLSY